MKRLIPVACGRLNTIDGMSASGANRKGEISEPNFRSALNSGQFANNEPIERAVLVAALQAEADERGITLVRVACKPEPVAGAALRKGGIDWWENPSRDLVDEVAGDPNITVVSHFATANGIMTFNQLHPPFNNPAIRRALLGAIDQAEAISTIAGADHDNWHDGIGLFGAGTPFATDVGIEVLKGARDYAKVKRALEEAGYNGEGIVVMAPTDVHELGNLTRTGAEQLRRAGMKVDLQEMDFGSVVRRRANQGPPDKGGYNMFCTLIDRSLPNTHPFGHLAIRADGNEPINGWASSPKIEELRTAWLATADLGEQTRLCAELQKRLWEDVPYIPLGEYWQASAYRKNLTDVIPGCFATFYGVRPA